MFEAKSFARLLPSIFTFGNVKMIRSYQNPTLYEKRGFGVQVMAPLG
jgi:hypothetical protein